MSTQKDISARDGYDLWAATYDASPNPVVAVDELVLAEVIDEATGGDVSGQVVLDAGCGTGRHTVRLARSAARVIAMDFSGRMLEQVRAKLAVEDGPAAVELVEHDLHQLLPLADRCVDGVVCALVGEHLRDLDPVMAELARVTRPGGWLVFSVYHPLLAMAGKEANFCDPQTGVEYRLGAVTHLVADYVNAAIAAGFCIEALREQVADDTLRDHIPGFERYRGKPLLLVIRASRSVRT